MPDDKKAKKPKFDNLLDVFEGQKDSSTQVPKSQNTQGSVDKDTQVPKSRNQLLKQGKMKQVKLLIDTDTYKRFRMANIDRGTDMSATVETLMQTWLEAYNRQQNEDN